MEAEPGRGPSVEPLCPSAPPSEGAVILAVEGVEGELAYLRPAIPLGSAAHDLDHSAVGDLLRFASPCRSSGCAHWRGGRCNLVDTLVGVATETEDRELPRCAIRSRCRWFAQDGKFACSVCTNVRRNNLIPLEALDKEAAARATEAPAREHMGRDQEADNPPPITR
ncbi:hypothetical protein GCM10012320_18620 [Sinomonas cellulolyticus]|nr:hypothetical protein GCM10012320_18620 [Sinomonas sp. KCTC 49339]